MKPVYVKPQANNGLGISSWKNTSLGAMYLIKNMDDEIPIL